MLKPHPRDRWRYVYQMIGGGIAATVIGTGLALVSIHYWIEPWIYSSVMIAASGVLITGYGLLGRRRVHNGRDPFSGAPDDRIQKKIEPHEPDQYADGDHESEDE